MRRLVILVMVVVACVGTLFPISGTAAAASEPVVGGYSRVYNYGYLRMRTGPGYGYGIRMNMNRGEVVKVLGGPYNGEWYKVSYRGVTGYSIRAGLTHTGLAGQSIGRSYYRVVVVSLARQQAEVYQNGKLVWVSSATTGRPGLATPVGTTQVMAKLSPYKFVSPWPKGHQYYYEPAWANYAIRYRSGGYYLHDAPWRPYYGYGTNYGHYDPDGVWRTGSHGCVNLPYWSAQKMYGWITVGTTVKVVSY